jgi:hypothetical protein
MSVEGTMRQRREMRQVANGDPDIPVLKEARAEFAKLQ